MITLVTGGTKCGKSGYAEKILERFEGQKYYIATMNPVGDDAEEIIARHVEMRCGKNYVTVERLRDIGDTEIPEGSGVLLECVGNLCANEMFENKIEKPTDKILSGILKINSRAEVFVIVTNQVGEDGIEYPKDTMNYIKNIGEINKKISKKADCVIEAVYGIPIVLKGDRLLYQPKSIIQGELPPCLL